MNSINEKEKKLNTALDELKNLDLSNPNLRNNIENLNSQKTQLEIEKSQLEDKYKSLL
jgi:5-formyltetrahydrofolate cyclo-ligase